MTTMYAAVTASRTADGAPLTGGLVMDLLGNDWSAIGGTMDIALPEVSLASSTLQTWTTMVQMWFEMPTYALDATYDDLELAIALRVESYVSASPDCLLRLGNDGLTLFSNEVAVTAAAYAQTALMTLVLPVTTGQTRLVLQGYWDSNPTQTLYARRLAHSTDLSGDCELFIRAAT